MRIFVCLFISWSISFTLINKNGINIFRFMFAWRFCVCLSVCSLWNIVIFRSNKNPFLKKRWFYFTLQSWYLFLTRDTQMYGLTYKFLWKVYPKGRTCVGSLSSPGFSSLSIWPSLLPDRDREEWAGISTIKKYFECPKAIFLVGL